ncbi:MAG TPA: low temperature requirement protein A [Solirubrobacteraceae bacterium]|nr:low temperature requirement protein A [Solirubrobacteraceae bacterium]
MRLRSTATEPRPTWLELFFDLVFVVALAQLSHLLVHGATATRFLEYFGMFVAVWFTWVGFTAYADRFDVDDATHRVLVLGAALANVVVAIHVDDAFSGGSAPFAKATIAARILLLAVTDRARRGIPEARRFQTYYEAGWIAGLALWVASLLVPTPLRYALWAAALAVEAGTPLLWRRRVATVPLVSAHIAERFGLFTIIVLGESVVSVASGIAHVNFELGSSVVAVGTFVMAAMLWWVYFDCVTTVHADSPWYLYTHVFVYAGLGTVAPGALLAILDADDAALPAGARAALCGGVAVLLLALAVIELTSRPPPAAQRRAAARGLAGAAAIGLAFAGAALSPVATVLVLVALVAADLGFELATLRLSSPASAR